MQIYAVNASPRKKWNTATLLQNALDGAVEAGGADVQAEMIHLYDYSYTGCRSCFQCKRIDGKYYGQCAIKDGITPVLEKLSQADAIVFGSPIYFGNVVGMLRTLEERLLFPYSVYDKNFSSLAPKKIRTAFIYTMNAPAEIMQEWGYPAQLNLMEKSVGSVFGHQPQVMYANNTLQFSDYSKYKNEIFSEKDKLRYREEHFPADCNTAKAIGAALIS